MHPAGGVIMNYVTRRADAVPSGRAVSMMQDLIDSTNYLVVRVTCVTG